MRECRSTRVETGACGTSWSRTHEWNAAHGCHRQTEGPRLVLPLEKTYGYPVSHWFAVLDKAAGLKHGEQVALLKGEHGLGHGHANALVAYHRARDRVA